MKKEKIIDWELAKQLANGKAELAKELFQMLLDTLPQHKQEISEAYQQKNLKKLVTVVHKLHGAVCYCGTPRLKQAAQDLEILAKTQQTKEIQQAYQKIIEEIDEVLKEGAKK